MTSNGKKELQKFIQIKYLGQNESFSVIFYDRKSATGDNAFTG
jgi:hypothetical protein